MVPQLSTWARPHPCTPIVAQRCARTPQCDNPCAPSCVSIWDHHELLHSWAACNPVVWDEPRCWMHPMCGVDGQHPAQGAPGVERMRLHEAAATPSCSGATSGPSDSFSAMSPLRASMGLSGSSELREVLGLSDPSPNISAAERLQFPAWSESKDHNSRHALRGGREARLFSRPAFPAARSQWEGSVLHGVAGTAPQTSCESREAAGSSYYAVDD
ncbi:hypothetical protein LEMLEM_LOCUS4442 [Lemmus lemmus]